MVAAPIGTLHANMAIVRAFRGLRFSAEAGPISQLVAPPYDVISPSERAALAAKNPRNVVELTLPETHDDDRSKFVKYARSAATLAEWRRSGVLQLESRPAMYRYSQSFTIPGDTKTYTRTQLMTALKVESYDKGVVLPHEQTFPKHKEDRLKILEATRAHLECIYGLFEDPDRSVHELIVAAPASQTQEFVADDGVTNRLEVIDDPASIQAIAAHMADKKVWIADGHHRYETAVTYREMQGPKAGLIAEDFMMMALSSMSDPGLVILPTHRIVPNVPLDEAAFEAKLGTRFEVERMPNDRLMAALKSTPADARTIAIAWKSGVGFVCRIPNANQVLEWIDGPESARLKELDVTILHRIIFEELLGLSGLEFFSYTRDPDEALGSVSNGADAAFLMNPPSVDDMRIIALGHEKMPQKSTYYYPKLLSGLALWSLSDFEQQ